MRPHEETLIPSTQGTQPALVSASDGRMVCAFREQDSDAWQTLFRGAPAMAQALLSHLKRHGERMACGCWSCADARAALTKGGVPLP